ncbi:unnamed protein product [Allacma fusca]|uniref:Uncharacterized protein n=1 Tax=Allacma fusca TaxID=39272 RepID=A0A8J2LJS6_9HEXA|nr:unnamed protein product [Allacma fusca]
MTCRHSKTLHMFHMTSLNLVQRGPCFGCWSKYNWFLWKSIEFGRGKNMPGDGDVSPGEEPESGIQNVSSNGFQYEKSDTAQEALNALNVEYSRLKEQYEALAKSKDSTVMRYANSEKEVIKLRKDLENSDKHIKSLMKDAELMSQKNKQLTVERNRLFQMSESKSNVIEEENRRLRIRVEDLQNELKGVEITKSQFLKDFTKEKNSLHDKVEQYAKQNSELQQELEKAGSDIEELRQRNVEAEEVDNLQKECDKLKEDLSSKEFIIKWTQDRVLALECECEQVRHHNVELLNDMSTCRSKEIELLAYTQQVTEKNVSLQSKLSSLEAKVSALEEDNKRMSTKIEESSGEAKGFERTLSIEKKGFSEEKQTLLDEIEEQKGQIFMLQQQLDEARGEIVLLKKKHDSSLKELSKELRRQIKDSSSLEGMSQSSRASSCSSLNTIETNPNKQNKTPELSLPERQDIELPVIPDQQVLVERILKLQRVLVKKQEKVDFLQDHGNQLVDELQKKCKIIQAYAMSQDPGALSSDLSDQSKAEVVKYGGVMASLYSSKPSDEGLTLELSLQINSKLQAVLEDALLKNITLKENISTLGAEIFKLTELNKQLQDKMETLGDKTVLQIFRSNLIYKSFRVFFVPIESHRLVNIGVDGSAIVFNVEELTLIRDVFSTILYLGC